MSGDPVSRPLRADAARNRARIVAAAQMLFARDGLAVGLNAIAAEAGVGAGTLHRQFPAKAGLVAAIVAARLRERIAAADAARRAGREPAQVLRELIVGLLDDGYANRALKDLLAAEGTTVRAYDPATADAFAATLARLVAAARRRATIDPDLRPADVGALLAGGLAAEAHLADDPGRIPIVRARLLATLDPRAA